MKYRVLLTTFMTIWFMNLNAQIFIGGTTGVELSNSKSPMPETYDHSFSLSPFVGKFISEKYAIGISLSTSFEKRKANDYNNIQTTVKSSGVGISPFIRYYPIQWNKFSVYFQGNIGTNYTKSNTEAGGNTTNSKYNSIYLNVHPGLSYDISDKFSLQTSINILSLNYYYIINRQASIKYESSIFNFGAGLENVISTNMCTVGAIFKF